MRQAVSTLLSDCDHDLARIKAEIDPNPLHSRTPYLIGYALIRASSTIETALKASILEFFSPCPVKQMASYLDKRVRRSSMNPSFDNMCSILKEFDKSWHASFKSAYKAHPDKVKLLSSLNSLCEARNTFAHQGTCRLTIANVVNYYNDAKEFVRFFDNAVK